MRATFWSSRRPAAAALGGDALMWVLAGIVVIAGGFLLRFNPLLVIIASALVTGFAAGWTRFGS